MSDREQEAAQKAHDRSIMLNHLSAIQTELAALANNCNGIISALNQISDGAQSSSASCSTDRMKGAVEVIQQASREIVLVQENLNKLNFMHKKQDDEE